MPKPGRPADVTDDEILDVLEAVDEPVVTTSEVASMLPIGERGARTRLQDLAERGIVATKTVGRARVWYLPGNERPQGEREAGGEPSPAPPSDRTPDEQERDHAAPGGPASAESVSAALADLDLPGSGELLERRRDLVANVVRRIQEEGSARKSELLELVDLDDVGYASPESVWKNLLQPALHELAEQLDELESPGEGGHRWQWIELSD